MLQCVIPPIPHLPLQLFLLIRSFDTVVLDAPCWAANAFPLWPLHQHRHLLYHWWAWCPCKQKRLVMGHCVSPCRQRLCLLRLLDPRHFRSHARDTVEPASKQIRPGRPIRIFRVQHCCQYLGIVSDQPLGVELECQVWLFLGRLRCPGLGDHLLHLTRN